MNEEVKEDLTVSTWPGKKEAVYDSKEVFENICEVEERVFTSQRTVRVWFSRTLEGPDSIEDWVTLKGYVHDHRRDEVTCLDYAILLSKELPRVNAVEVRDGDHGSIYYPTWP